MTVDPHATGDDFPRKVVVAVKDSAPFDFMAVTDADWFTRVFLSSLSCYTAR